MGRMSPLSLGLSGELYIVERCPALVYRSWRVSADPCRWLSGGNVLCVHEMVSGTPEVYIRL
jgi:hypothetical protein